MFNYRSILVSSVFVFFSVLVFAQNDSKSLNAIEKRQPVSKRQSPARIKDQKIFKEKTQKYSASFQNLILVFNQFDSKGKSMVIGKLDLHIEKQNLKSVIPSASKLFEKNNEKAMDNLFRKFSKEMILLYEVAYKECKINSDTQ
tara:strand:- start:2578 stop:3009 length:432 start_codon:yes stop_codon:yes gene_type:complete